MQRKQIATLNYVNRETNNLHGWHGRVSLWSLRSINRLVVCTTGNRKYYWWKQRYRSAVNRGPRQVLVATVQQGASRHVATQNGEKGAIQGIVHSRNCPMPVVSKATSQQIAAARN